MMRTFVVAAIGVVVLAGCGLAATWTLEALSSYSLMENTNSLLAELGAQADLEIPPLNVGYGLRLRAGFDLDGPIPAVYGTLWGEKATTGVRDISATVGFLGAGAGGSVKFRDWLVSTGLCVGAASMDIPSLRMADLSGLGFGLELSAAYAFRITSGWSATFCLGGRWLSVQEMTDAVGQKYRGRGMPFVDFTGLVASIGITWAP